MVYDLFLALEANKILKNHSLCSYPYLAVSALGTIGRVQRFVPCSFRKPRSPWQPQCQGSTLSTCRILHLDTTNQPECITFWGIHPKYRGTAAWQGRGCLQDGEFVYCCPISDGLLTYPDGLNYMTWPWWSSSFHPKGVFWFERQKLCHMKGGGS